MNWLTRKKESDQGLVIAPENVQPISESAAILQVIERAALDPNVDIDKMERLLQMQERIFDRRALIEFSVSMTRVQASMPEVAKMAVNGQTHSKYSKHEAIAKAIKPIYTSGGFSITFSEDDSPKDNHIRIVGILRHSSGHSEHHHLDVPFDNVGIKGNVNKTDTHATGSTYSYGRRYLTCLIFDVATGDDNDGNKPIPRISADQVNIINAAIVDNSLDMNKFLAWLKRSLKADSIQDINVNAYDTVINQINTTIKARNNAKN